MTELLTAAQMRAIEQAAIDSGEVTGLELMERAGQGVVDAIFEEWPELAGEGEVKPSDAQDTRGPAPAPPRYLGQKEGPFRAVVLCGPGNNGGDGFVVARLLHEQGWAVEVFLYGDAEKLPADALVNYERWLELGEVDPLTADCLSNCFQPKIIVDAIFGTGLTRPIPKEIDDFFDRLHSRDVLWKETRTRHQFKETIVSIDFPSGICADSGKVLVRPEHEAEFLEEPRSSAVERWFTWSMVADLTITFHMPKIGSHLNLGATRSGKLVYCDIGLRGDAVEKTVAISQSADLERARLLEPIFMWRKLPLQNFVGLVLDKYNSHKFSSGHVLTVSGPIGRTGATRLAARGALRIGAGLVTLGVPPKALQEAASQLTAIMLQQVETAEDLIAVLQEKRINALCIGPALGLERAKPLVAAALDAGLEARPTVLDADALSAFADEPGALFEMLHEKCVLTPHGGEFARLFPDIAKKLKAVPTKGPAYSKVDATREAAKRAGCVVLFKGADTVIAAPDGCCSINSAHYERSAPWLATAGSGDVLAGFITGLLARGFGPMQAAETAAWLHVECALKFGPGLIAEDIPEQLPAVFRDLGL